MGRHQLQVIYQSCDRDIAISCIIICVLSFRIMNLFQLFFPSFYKLLAKSLSLVHIVILVFECPEDVKQE